MITIDGSIGEGGGQVLRTCLSLSLITGKGFQIRNIRANRKRSGLRAQHLKAVEISARIGNANVEGANLNSTSITFSPKKISSGRYTIDIGTAGSTSLVLQTIYLPLSRGHVSSSIKLVGGTHSPWSPSFDFLKQHWLLFLEKMGFNVTLNLELAGFYPQGGGRLHAIIHPSGSVSPLILTKRGSLQRIRGVSFVSNLKRQIAERQRNRVVQRLGHHYPLNDIRVVEYPSKFKGTSICLICEFEHSQCCYFALGELGKPAESVADEVVDRIKAFLSTDTTIDEYLADQVLLPLSLANSRSTFSTVKITSHLLTNAEIIKAFLPVEIKISGKIHSPGIISINPTTS
jgi:RNA 3'-terminal phosphate cyclase (ATP)